MIGRARRSEPNRARPDAVAQFIAHELKVFGRRFLVEGALAHHVGAERRVPHVRGVVDPFGQVINRVQILRKGGPGPFDSRLHRVRRDIFGPFQISHDEQLVFLTAWRE